MAVSSAVPLWRPVDLPQGLRLHPRASHRLHPVLRHVVRASVRYGFRVFHLRGKPRVLCRGTRRYDRRRLHRRRLLRRSAGGMWKDGFECMRVHTTTSGTIAHSAFVLVLHLVSLVNNQKSSTPLERADSVKIIFAARGEAFIFGAVPCCKEVFETKRRY